MLRWPYENVARVMSVRQLIIVEKGEAVEGVQIACIFIHMPL